MVAEDGHGLLVKALLYVEAILAVIKGGYVDSGMGTTRAVGLLNLQAELFMMVCGSPALTSGLLLQSRA